MSKSKDISVLVIILIVLAFAIGYLLSQEGHLDSEYEVKEEVAKASSDTEYIQINAKEEVVSSNRVVISDKFVGEFDADGQVVVLDSSGSAYIVHDGVVLASNEVVIDARNEELSVVRLNERAKSISSN